VEGKNLQNYPFPLDNIVYSENTSITRGVTSEKFKINNTPKDFYWLCQKILEHGSTEYENGKISGNSKKEAKKF
jgi:hypothetical protein